MSLNTNSTELVDFRRCYSPSPSPTDSTSEESNRASPVSSTASTRSATPEEEHPSITKLKNALTNAKNYLGKLERAQASNKKFDQIPFSNDASIRAKFLDERGPN